MTEHRSFYTPTHSKASPDADVPLDFRVRQYAARARQMLAEAMAESLANAWQTLSRGVRTTAQWLLEQRRQAATRRALAACSDRTLADIGIPREHIHLAARGVDLGDPVAVSEAGLGPRLVASIRRMHERRRKQLRVYRELMGYSDRDLEEIGLRRSDIPGIARTA
jgi:uncharacterized protein YjiS (DUF1127 family)